MSPVRILFQRSTKLAIRLRGWLRATAIATGRACLRLSELARASRWLRTVAACLTGGTLLATAALGVLWLSVASVGPGERGVANNNWGAASGSPGYELPPGLHIAPRGLTQVHRLDSRVQLARFGFASEGANLPALEVRTAEGNAAKVHVTVPFRLRQGGAQRIVAAGLRGAWISRVRARIERVLADAFSRLGSDDLLDPAVLEATGVELGAALREELATLEASPGQVSIAGVYFAAPYEAKLLEQQLESQAIRTDESLARRARMKTENALARHALELEERNLAWELERTTEEQRLELEQRIARERRASLDELHARGLAGEAAYQAQVTEGELALARVHARAQQLVGRALDGPGGRLLMARELAEGLVFEQVTLDPGLTPGTGFFDLERWTRTIAGARDED